MFELYWVQFNSLIAEICSLAEYEALNQVHKYTLF